MTKLFAGPSYHVSKVNLKICALILITFHISFNEGNGIGQLCRQESEIIVVIYTMTYLNHLCDSPTCRCAFKIENAYHFFFNCPNYTNERVTLFNEIRNYLPINTEKLLFGDDSLTDQENSSIFIAVQTYIENTGRFAAVNQ